MIQTTPAPVAAAMVLNAGADISGLNGGADFAALVGALPPVAAPASTASVEAQAEAPAAPLPLDLTGIIKGTQDGLSALALQAGAALAVTPPVAANILEPALTPRPIPQPVPPPSLPPAAGPAPIAPPSDPSFTPVPTPRGTPGLPDAEAQMETALHPVVPGAAVRPEAPSPESASIRVPGGSGGKVAGKILPDPEEPRQSAPDAVVHPETQTPAVPTSADPAPATTLANAIAGTTDRLVAEPVSVPQVAAAPPVAAATPVASAPDPTVATALPRVLASTQMPRPSAHAAIQFEAIEMVAAPPADHSAGGSLEASHPPPIARRPESAPDAVTKTVTMPVTPVAASAADTAPPHVRNAAVTPGDATPASTPRSEMTIAPRPLTPPAERAEAALPAQPNVAPTPALTRAQPTMPDVPSATQPAPTPTPGLVPPVTAPISNAAMRAANLSPAIESAAPVPQQPQRIAAMPDVLPAAPAPEASLPAGDPAESTSAEAPPPHLLQPAQALADAAPAKPLITAARLRQPARSDNIAPPVDDLPVPAHSAPLPAQAPAQTESAPRETPMRAEPTSPRALDAAPQPTMPHTRAPRAIQMEAAAPGPGTRDDAPPPKAASSQPTVTAPTRSPDAFTVNAAPTPAPALTTPPSPSPAPQDFDTLVSRLADAREQATPHVVRTAFEHAEFGRVAMQVQHDGAGLSVTLASQDPEFAGAVQAAAATVATSSFGNGSPQPGDSQRQDPAPGQYQGSGNAGAPSGSPTGAGSGQGQPSRGDATGQQPRREGGTFSGRQDQPQGGAPRHPKAPRPSGDVYA